MVHCSFASSLLFAMKLQVTVNLMVLSSVPLLPMPNIGPKPTLDPSTWEFDTDEEDIALCTLQVCIKCVESRIMTFMLCLKSRSLEEIKEVIAGIKNFQDGLKFSTNLPPVVSGLIVTIYLVVQNPDEILSYLENESDFGNTRCFSRIKTQSSPPFFDFFGLVVGLN
jgi:hypothetical protein